MAVTEAVATPARNAREIAMLHQRPIALAKAKTEPLHLDTSQPPSARKGIRIAAS
ncbi:MAG: hypothetical protein M3306_11130 [Actinomycetota bacterium]|nr:hypothetical protein [Actinomycetota bacterium]